MRSRTSEKMSEALWGPFYAEINSTAFAIKRPALLKDKKKPAYAGFPL